ncbi:MAG TPA: hypothetical protein VHA14_01230 [Bryobacteraceae bacterium]|nr:hypothetical protein [Bryobacteraceae bacterium]
MIPSLKRLHQCAVLCIALRVGAQTAAIPDVPTLLREVLEHQRKTDAIREDYTFHELVRTDTLNGDGSVKESASEESEVFFVHGHRIIQLIKRDGAELNSRDKAKEEQRVRKEIEGYSKSPKPTERGRGGGRDHVVSRILSVAKTTNPRREMFRGRPTLVFDFEGDPKAKANGMDQNAAKKLAGTVWIDEADRQVARLEVRFYDNFRIGGFLANVQKGTSMNVDQTRIGDGLWMQTGSEDHLAARVVVKNLRMNVHIQDFDFQKFNVGTKEQIATP